MERDLQVCVFEATKLIEIESIKTLLEREKISCFIQNIDDNDFKILKLKVNLADEQRAFELIDKYLATEQKASQYQFRRAEKSEIDAIWEILQSAIERRREEGSNQWQNDYPNLQVIENDIDKGYGFVVVENNDILGYVALMPFDEAYLEINGNWLTDWDYIVLHRVAVSPKALGKGIAQEIFRQAENYAIENEVFSIKADTNFDNMAMLAIFGKMGYLYCGEVFHSGSPRMAFEKILK